MPTTQSPRRAHPPAFASEIIHDRILDAMSLPDLSPVDHDGWRITPTLRRTMQSRPAYSAIWRQIGTTAAGTMASDFASPAEAIAAAKRHLGRGMTAEERSRYFANAAIDTDIAE